MFLERLNSFLKKEKSLSFKIASLTFVVSFSVLFLAYLGRIPKNSSESFPQIVAPVKKPEFVKGIHLTAWVAGSKKARLRIEKLLEETELNTVVIAIKEYQGEVYIPGVPMAHQYKFYVNAIPDISETLADLKKKGIYTIARIVCFKDNALAKKKPELAVKKADGSLWTDYRGIAWTDPYHKEVWEYNLSVATQAVALGFEEIQFDYIRFPSDGDIKQCRYSYAAHNASSAVKNLENFLQEASKRLKPMGVNISIDIFGLTPSVPHDMGIGQKLVELTQWVDFVSPMVYPSHYAKGEYGIPEPNRQPYHVVYRTMSDAKKKLGEKINRLRPYLQDFSLGYKYGASEVRAQIQACEDNGIFEWLLWDPNSQYTRAALRTKDGKLPALAHVPKTVVVSTQPVSDSDTKQEKSTEVKKIELPLPWVSPTPSREIAEEEENKKKEYE